MTASMMLPTADAIVLDADVASGSPPTPPISGATLRLWNAFASLSPETRRWALAVGQVRCFRAGDLFEISDEVAVVISGCLAVDAADTRLTADLLGQADVISTGEGPGFRGQWITDGEAYCAAPGAWFDKAGTEGSTYLLTGLRSRLARVERRILCATGHRATARVADLFLTVHETAPGPGIPLSQERIGAMLGLRRTTVNGSCRTLEAGGGTRTRRGQVRVTDAAALAQAACGCRHGAQPQGF